MKITGIRTARVTRELDPAFRAAWDPNPRRVTEATLVFEADRSMGSVRVG